MLLAPNHRISWKIGWVPSGWGLSLFRNIWQSQLNAFRVRPACKGVWMLSYVDQSSFFLFLSSIIAIIFETQKLSKFIFWDITCSTKIRFVNAYLHPLNWDILLLPSQCGSVNRKKLRINLFKIKIQFCYWKYFSRIC